jgi:diguanylate cyclase (GGDEF)-like protein
MDSRTTTHSGGAPAKAASERDALMRVAAAAAGANDLDEVVEVAAEEALRAVGAASLTVDRWERDRNVLRTHINVGRLGPGQERFPEDEVYPVEGSALLEKLLLHGQPYFNAIDDPSRDERSVALLRKVEKDSFVAVPVMVEGETWGEVWASTAPGEPRFRAGDIRFLEAIAGQLAIAIGRAELFSRVSRLAYEDALTGLANRRAIEERLERAVVRARQRKSPMSLLLCDLDNLKQVNDERGHDVGDRALRRAGEALVSAAAAHPGSAVGRLSGDEFCVILEGAGLDEARSLGGAAVRTLAADRDLAISISCGAAALDDSAATPSTLLRAADAAQFVAKRKGGGQVATVTPGSDRMPTAAERRLFRGGVDQRIGAAVDLLLARLDGELADAKALDRLEAVAQTLSQSVNAAGWTISHAPLGSGLVRSIANADSRQQRLRGVRIGLENEVYPLEQYPATRAVVATGSGGFAVRKRDASADPAERSLLEELGYETLIAATAANGSGTWLVELFGDDASVGLTDALPPLRLLVRAAIPPRAAEGALGAEQRRARGLDLMLALSHRLAAANGDLEALQAVGEELERAFRTPNVSVVRLRGDGQVEQAAPRATTWHSDWSQPANAGLIGRCLRDGESVVVGDVTAEPDFRPTPGAPEVRSELVVPVTAGGRLWGVINLESEDHDAFDGEDARVVEAAADLLGSALGAGDLSAPGARPHAS